jgi:hypothetical protein
MPPKQHKGKTIAAKDLELGSRFVMPNYKNVVYEVFDIQDNALGKLIYGKNDNSKSERVLSVWGHANVILIGQQLKLNF